MMRYSDVPNLVSLDYLRQIDRDPPGTWLAQKKIDGRRRMIFHTPQSWQYVAKNKGDAQPLPKELRESFESQAWWSGVGLDCEWSGPRHVGGKHELWIFDILYYDNDWYDNDWLGNRDFLTRYGWLKTEFINATTYDGDGTPPNNIHLLPVHKNPGLVDFYAEQLTDPLSEGIVVRRADSKLVGSIKGCAVNPHWFKIKHREATKELP